VTEYGAGTFREELAFAGLKIVQAWELLNGGQIGHLEAEAYMNLCRDAGYGEDAVQKAGTAWANRKLDAKLQVS
jgi:hypothetical protein